MSNSNKKPTVKLEDKLLWSVKEASSYSGIGEPRIRELAKQDGCPFSLRVGRRICIKKKEFEEYLSNAQQI